MDLGLVMTLVLPATTPMLGEAPEPEPVRVSIVQYWAPFGLVNEDDRPDLDADGFAVRLSGLF